MDFFESQDRARRKTKGLVFLFLVAVVLIVLSVYVVLLLVARWMGMGTAAMDPSMLRIWDPLVFAWATGLSLSVIAMGSLYKIASLREGGEAVARMLGGRPVSPDTHDPEERRLLNVVEEMSIASGLPVPEVYLLENEKGINAFAAGNEPGNAVIGVTRGTMELLSRDELQGVIGHEFSHILNGDMRLNIRLMGILHGILIIALIGYWILRSTGRVRMGRGKGAAPVFAAGLGLLIIGYVGLFFARMIKAAVSRQREYLADAAAVQFTRNPEGLAGALRKIGGLVAGSRLRSAHAEEASHFYFSQGVVTFLGGLLATHPPLAERIRRVDERFTGEFPVVDPKSTRSALLAEEERMGVMQMAQPSPAPPPPPPPAAPPKEAASSSLEPSVVVQRVGTLDTTHIEYARELISRLPEELNKAAHEPDGAQGVVFALLLDIEPARREFQLQVISEAIEPHLYQETERVLPLVDDAPEEARLPLVDLTMPALRRLSERQYRAFYEAVRKLVTADRKMGLFEYALQQVLVRHLRAHFEKVPPPAVKYKSLHPVRDHCSVVLSALAHHGGSEGAVLAFAAGAHELGRPGKSLALQPPSECTLRHVDRALKELAHLTPELKKQMVEACTACIVHDRYIAEAEAELLRAVSATLDCPMPPFIPGKEI